MEDLYCLHDLEELVVLEELVEELVKLEEELDGARELDKSSRGCFGMFMSLSASVGYDST